MKKLLGSFNVSRPSRDDVIVVSVRDENSKDTFLEIEIPYSEFTKAITGLWESGNCTLNVSDLSNVGKIRETKNVIVEFPEETPYGQRAKVAENLCNMLLLEEDEGWFMQDSFLSKNSFYTKLGVSYCQGRAVRYVEEV